MCEGIYLDIVRFAVQCLPHPSPPRLSPSLSAAEREGEGEEGLGEVKKPEFNIVELFTAENAEMKEREKSITGSIIGAAIEVDGIRRVVNGFPDSLRALQ
jgi:hypothetical protein